MSNVARPKKFIKRPDDSSMKKSIEQLRADIKNLDLASGEISALIDRIKLDSTDVERKKELQAELKDIIAQQSSFKADRAAIQSQIKNIDTHLKRKITEIQKITSKSNFKSAAEIDTRVNYLDDLIGSGDLKLAEERKFIKEMTSLRKLRKDFAEVDTQQASIDKDKVRISELKVQLGKVGNKEVQTRFESIQKELDDINASNKSTYEQRSNLINKRNELRKAKDSKYNEIRKLRADFDAEFTKFKEQLAEEQKKRDEEYKARQEEEKLAKRKDEAKRKLEEASVPAFTEEINEIHSLLAYFDPTYKKTQNNTVADATKPSFSSEANVRKVEMPEDVVILKKEQQPFFQGSSAKKLKKKVAKLKNFTVDPDVIVSLSNLSIPLPVKLGEVTSTIETLKDTLRALEERQDEQTQKNIKRAEEEIAKLEDEEST